MKTYLITGGSGLVGKRLSELLIQKGYKVKHLSRNPKKEQGIETYKWDLSKNYVDPLALKNVDVIVHLAGADIMEKSWTKDRKRVLIESRTKGLEILKNFLMQNEHQVKTLISSSAQGFYEPNKGRALKEDEPADEGYMGQLCRVWEDEALSWEQMGIRVVINRIGLVLAANGGVLDMIKNPIKKGVSSYFGNGKQMYPWIHIDDLCGMIMHEAESKSIKGTFNAAAPNSLNQRKFTKAVAKVLNKKFIAITLPKFILKLMMGERSGVLVDSFHLSAEKIQKEGYLFQYSTLDIALSDLL